jgi:hypothetical protein
LMLRNTHALRYKMALFVRNHRKCEPLLSTEDEWLLCEQLENCLKPFYNHTLTVSHNAPCLNEAIGIMWGIDDFLDDVRKGEGHFQQALPDIQRAFKKAVKKFDDYQKEINKNIMYYTAAVLDPRFKTSVIIKQCGTGAMEIIQRVRDYLKKEYPFYPKADLPVRSREDYCPKGMSIHQYNLLKMAQPSVVS